MRLRGPVILLAVIGLAGVPAHPALNACDGMRVIKDDLVGDVVDPFVAGQVVPGSGTPDLSGFSAAFSSAGLGVTWHTSGNPIALPSERGHIRYLLFGYWEDFWSTGAVPYAFLDVAGPAGGRGVSFVVGLGQHFPPDVTATNQLTRWVDLVASPAFPMVSDNSISTVIPDSRLYHTTVSGFIYPQGVSVSDQFDDDATFGRGRPTAPVAAVAFPPPVDVVIPIPGQGQTTWGITDWAPNGRATGSPLSGYRVEYRIDSLPPELCRPDPPFSLGDPQTCRFLWSEVAGPAWLAGRIETTGGQTNARLELESSRSLWSAAPAAGVVANTGLLHAVVVPPFGSGTAAYVQANDSSVAIEDDVGTGGVSIFLTFRPAAFPAAGPAWVFALIPDGVVVRTATFTASGPGLTCGGAATGREVGFLQPQHMPEATSVDAGDMWSGRGVTVTAGGRLRLTARRALVAFFGGNAYGGQATIVSFWEKAPDGTILRAFGHRTAFPMYSHLYAVDVGGPGTYEFGVDYGIWSRLLEAPSLIWADIAWP